MRKVSLAGLTFLFEQDLVAKCHIYIILLEWIYAGKIKSPSVQGLPVGNSASERR